MLPLKTHFALTELERKYPIERLAGTESWEWTGLWTGFLCFPFVCVLCFHPGRSLSISRVYFSLPVAPCLPLAAALLRSNACVFYPSSLFWAQTVRVAKQSSCRENRADIEELGERGSNQPDQALLQVGTSNPEVVSCAAKTWDWQVCLTPSDRSLLMFLLSFNVLCISEDKEPRPIYASIFMYIVHVYRSIRCFGKIWRWFLI